MNSFESRPRHTALLLGRLGLEPGCSREDVEIRWLRMLEEAEGQGMQMDSACKECYDLLQDDRRWAGRAQGRKPAVIDQDVRLFLLESGMVQLLSSKRVSECLTGMTLEGLTKLDKRAMVEMGFSPRHRFLLELALGRVESPSQALSLLLQEAGLTSFDEVLKLNRVDIHSLGLLTSQDLDEMGISDPPLRRKFEALQRHAPSFEGSMHLDEPDEVEGMNEDDFPVLRLLGQMDGKVELDNAISIIRDMHAERVDVVSRICQEVVAERLASFALRKRLGELEGELSLRRSLVCGGLHDDINSCVTAMVTAGLALPQGGGWTTAADQRVVRACADALVSVCEADALRAWQASVIDVSPGEGESGETGDVNRVDRLRAMVAQNLRWQRS